MMWTIANWNPMRWRGRYAGALLLVALGVTACGSGDDDSQDITPQASGVALVVSWAPNPASDAILGYRVYQGPDPTTATQLVSDLAISAGVLDPNAPMVTYNAGLDLGLKAGDPVCFRLIAYNGVGASGFSGAACTTI